MSAEPRPVLDPLFEGALRKALAQRVVATKPKHSRRRVVLGGALALALAGGGVAVAEQLDLLPGSETTVALGPGVSSTHAGSATVELGPRPAEATDVAIELRCLTAGSFVFPDGAGSECTDADAGLSVSNYTVTLSPGQHSVTIETSAEARWSVVAAYVNRQVSPWAVNAHGETYGVENEQGTPDLVAVVATNGHGGYAYARDLESVHSRQPASPEEATRWQGSFVAVPVYESDGRTVVGEFQAGS